MKDTSLPAEIDALREELSYTQGKLVWFQESMHILFQQAPVPMFVVDRQSIVLDANLAAQQLFTDNEIPILSRGLYELLERSSFVALKRSIDRALTEGVNVTTERLNIRVLGAEKPYQAHANVHSLPNIDNTQKLLIIFEINEGESTNEYWQTLYRALLKGTEDLVYVFNTDGHLLLANDALFNLLGVESSEILGKTCDEYLPLSDAIRHRGADERVIRTGVPAILREELHASDGSVRRFTTRKFPIYNESGLLLGVAGISRDTTDEEQLRTWERMSEQVFQLNTEAIIITDIEKKIIRVNPAFERITGYSADTVTGKKPSLLKSGHQNPDFYRDMWETIERLGYWTGELTNRTADGSFYKAFCTISVLRDERGLVQGYIGIQSDITALRGAQDKSHKLAHYDPLTGLPNRLLMLDRLEQLLNMSERRNREFAVLFLDLDYFKEVNDSLGHSVGDELLINIKDRMLAALRSGDTVARIGGDEFLILLPETGEDASLAVAEKLISGLHRPMDLADTTGYTPSISIGIAIFPSHGRDAASLIQHADTAMYQSKSNGRNRFTLYGQSMGELIKTRFELRNALPLALKNGEFRVFLQPQFDLNNRLIVGAEALIRWQQPERDRPTPPGEFLEAIEGTPLLNKIDTWVLESVIEIINKWKSINIIPEIFSIAVNQTADDIKTSVWADRLRGLMASAGVSPARLEIELVESVLAEESLTIQSNLRQLREMGVSLAIDDFGTGYSNLAYLTRMPFTLLKIDMQFVRNMQGSASDLAVVKTIINLAKSLGVRTLAEGVETEEQAQMLSELGCDWGQGYLISPPIPVDEFEQRFLVKTSHSQ